MNQVASTVESRFTFTVRMKEWREANSGAFYVTFYLGRIQVASIMHDERMEPSWCVQVRPLVNGWKNPDYRFETRGAAIECVKDVLSSEAESRE